MTVRVRIFTLITLLLGGVSAFAQPVPVPSYLPQYGVQLNVDPHRQIVDFHQTVTWTNRTQRPTDFITLNFYPHYRIPQGDYLLLAKTLELLRLNPSYGIDRNGRQGNIESITLNDPTAGKCPLVFSYSVDNPTTIHVQLPKPVAAGESISFELVGSVCLPNKQGRWGKWRGITYFANALPVVAYYDDAGWHDTPFVPWHQPFWFEAGVYKATITLPTDHVLASSAAVDTRTDLGDGRSRCVMKPFVGRDFAMTCSAEYKEFCSSVKIPDGRTIALKCVAYPQHEFYAKEMLRIVSEAIPVYSDWFGTFPYDQFTIAESYFGWNGNECSGMILIDERVFDMPKLAVGYVEYLVSHETSHQWWYNQVGTNGYAETFMDEGPASYFTHRLLDQNKGKNNRFTNWPDKLKWLPDIERDNYRWAAMQGAIRRDEVQPAAAPLPEFGHLIGLFTGAYDRGSKVFGMIEARLGPEFLPFIRALVRKYSFKVLTADMLKAELVAFTGPQSASQWDEFFDRWVYGKGLVDWKIDSVRVNGRRPRRWLASDPIMPGKAGGGARVEVTVEQTRELNEPTVLGFQLAEGDGYPIRVPIGPGSEQIPLNDLDAVVEKIDNCKYIVRISLPCEPVQIRIDPDQILLDANAGNNFWRRPPRVRITPFYSVLNETDLTNDYDRWNFSLGPWMWGPMYLDPWYTRSTMLGIRAGAYKTQEFTGGAYVAARTDYRDVVAGVDALLDHWPFAKTQVGFNYERRIAGPYGGEAGSGSAERAVIFGRYIFRYHSSLYLPPMSYIDAFTTYQDNFLPFTRTPQPGAVRPSWTQLNGLHYRLNLYTPYWDPERGVWVDLTAAGGVVELNNARTGSYQVRGELATAQRLPDCMGYLSQVKAAGRVVVMAGGPDQGEYYALGGGNLFRGYDLAQRQGSFLWVVNSELRFPIAQDLRWNALDSVAGVRGLNIATFYDVGSVYTNGKAVIGTAQALGAGLRVDLSIFSFIERATVRFDVGKTINDSTPVQFWFGVQNPF